MRPANFPSRKNDRRIFALARLTSAQNTKADRLNREPGFSRDAEIRALRSVITSDEAARAIRTKKDRSGRTRVRA